MVIIPHFLGGVFWDTHALKVASSFFSLFLLWCATQRKRKLVVNWCCMCEEENRLITFLFISLWKGFGCWFSLGLDWPLAWVSPLE